MTLRRFLAIIIALAVVLGVTTICISGCSDTKKFELTESKIGGLVAVSKQNEFIEGYSFDQYVLYDPDTLVMYVMIITPRGSSVSALYNPDGTPKLYNPENN